jgi:uncharacterized protein
MVELTKHYIAYDSDLSASHMAAVCPNALPGEIVTIEGWRLAFNREGRATLLSIEGARAYGTSWHLSNECEFALDATKSVGSGLCRKITIQLESGPALLYLPKGDQFRLATPSENSNILASAATVGLPDAYRDEIATWRGHVTAPIVEQVIGGYGLPHDGIHGPQHWLRVLENGLHLAALTPGADPAVIECFALLHDSRRIDEDFDEAHGQRAANLARDLANKGLLKIEPARLERLIHACAFHDKGTTSSDPTIGCCWDADRLELSRLGIRPLSRFLSTKAALDAAVQKLAWKRGCDWARIPDLAQHWAIL